MKKNLLDVLEGKAFNEDEAKKIAIALERQGYRFYHGMKDRVREERIRSVFEKMSHEEQKHVSDIESLLPDPDSGWYLDPAAEEIVQQYFEGYMEGGIFPSGADAETSVMKLEDEIQAVRMAFDFEKDAVVFYTEMAKRADASETKKNFQALIEFEKGHVRILGDLLRLLES